MLPIRDLALGVPATVSGTIMAAGVKTLRTRNRSLFEFVLDDGTARLHCRWWNVPHLSRAYAAGDRVLVFGKPRDLRPRLMEHPEVERFESEDDLQVHMNRIVPVHPLTEGLSGRVLRTLVWQALAAFADAAPPVEPGLVPELRPDGKPWPTRAQAVRDLHFPGEPEDSERARERFALEEFLSLQLGIQRRRLKLESHGRPLPCAGDNRWIRPFLGGLGFRLTAAQTQVLREIRSDLAGAVPMRRLLQGDVGSGKTVVAACAALMTLESGCDVALMAPTEILANQLGSLFQRWFSPLGIPVTLRAGGRVEALVPGSGSTPGLVVGTQALIQEGVGFRRLGLVIIDEQHRFGVAHREELVRKGRYPHLLVMTATPIPRTLGLTLYGDLDVSVLREVPAGRQPVRTHVREESVLPRVWAFVRGEIEAGRQAYVVCPRVSDSDPDGVRSVTAELARVQEALAPAVVAMVHGRMAPAEGAAAMDGFRSGRVQVLVATPVIEVGVDVPNATVMVILSAELFGLAQLHQLRGRVGRGRHASHCILVAGPGKSGAERLAVVAATTDGFELAEADLRLRGPGELLGQAQSGLPQLRFGDLVTDVEWVRHARDQVRAHLWPKEPSASAAGGGRGISPG